MIWAIVILLGLVAVPVVIELTRDRMDEGARADAPGQFAQLPQGLTHYEWFGPQRGPVMVCVHGLTTPSFVWRGMVKGLAVMGYRVLTYDLFGRGYSDRPYGRQNAKYFTRQLNDLLKHEGARDNITLIGYSMGGAIVTAFAAKHTGRVRQLILIAPAGMGVIASRSVRLIARIPLIGDWLMLALYPGSLRKSLLAERGLKSTVDGITDLQEKELQYRRFVPSVLSSMRGILRRPMEQEHRAIHVAQIPVLAIWGQEDDVIPLSAIGTLTQWSRNTVQEVIEDAGHGLTYTHTDDILRIIAANVTR